VIRCLCPSRPNLNAYFAQPPLCLLCIVVSCLVCIFVILCVFVVLCVCVCTAVFTLDAGLLARSQYSEGPATGHLDTGFFVFPVSISKC